MNDQLLWFASRGAGIVSLLLLTGVVCLGVLTSVRWSAPTWPRFLTAHLHRNLALLSVAFVALHVLSAVLDPFVELGWLTLIVPFSSVYRQVWLGLGVLSVDLVLAIIVTSLLRARIGLRTWRAVHWLAYAAWPLALLHGFGTGTDGNAVWMLAIDAVCVAAVAVAIAWRLVDAREQKRRLVTAGMEG